MPKMHLRHLVKTKKNTKIKKKTVDWRYIYQKKKLDEACF